MGIETSSDHGGAEASFTSAILAIEELAKIDPSVSVLCDVHNTLVNTIFRTYANEEQKQKWLPLLAQEKVWPISSIIALRLLLTPFGSWDPSACQSQRAEVTLLPYKRKRSETGIIGSLTVPRCGSQTVTKPKSS
jgi:hypothetical protein